NVFPVGATVSIDAKDEFLIGDYRYSFLKTDQYELAGGVGIFGGTFKFDTTTVGNEGPGRTGNTNTHTSRPVPPIGASLDWYINPQWKIAGAVSGIKANIGNVDGRVLVATVGTEFMLVRNFGIGVRYMYTDADVDASKDSFDGSANWKMNSVSLYAKFLF